MGTTSSASPRCTAPNSTTSTCTPTGTLLFRQAQEAVPEGFTFRVFARNTAARAFYERAGCRVVAAGDGGGNEEHEPDVTYEWTP
jgi:hypothetical protein